MTRKESRELAFCLVFEQTINGCTMDEIFHAASEARDDFLPDAFAEAEAFGVEEHVEEIDSVIEKNIKGWSIKRLSKVTLAILRLSIYEIMFDDSIPASVSVNEAVEIAKKFGGKDDAPYINGVLSTIVNGKSQTADTESEE